MRPNRWWLALLYALATVLAQGVHDHGGGTDQTVARHVAGCDDPRLHLSGHPSPDLSHWLDDCAACQYRTSHHAFELPALTYFRPSTAVAFEDHSTPAPARHGRRISCRAPPCV